MYNKTADSVTVSIFLSLVSAPTDVEQSPSDLDVICYMHIDTKKIGKLMENVV